MRFTLALIVALLAVLAIWLVPPSGPQEDTGHPSSSGRETGEGTSNAENRTGSTPETGMGTIRVVSETGEAVPFEYVVWRSDRGEVGVVTSESAEFSLEAGLHELIVFSRTAEGSYFVETIAANETTTLSLDPLGRVVVSVVDEYGRACPGAEVCLWPESRRLFHSRGSVEVLEEDLLAARSDLLQRLDEASRSESGSEWFDRLAAYCHLGEPASDAVSRSWFLTLSTSPLLHTSDDEGLVRFDAVPAGLGYRIGTPLEPYARIEPPNPRNNGGFDPEHGVFAVSGSDEAQERISGEFALKPGELRELSVGVAKHTLVVGSVSAALGDGGAGEVRTFRVHSVDGTEVREPENGGPLDRHGRFSVRTLPGVIEVHAYRIVDEPDRSHVWFSRWRGEIAPGRNDIGVLDDTDGALTFTTDVVLAGSSLASTVTDSWERDGKLHCGVFVQKIRGIRTSFEVELGRPYVLHGIEEGVRVGVIRNKGWVLPPGWRLQRPKPLRASAGASHQTLALSLSRERRVTFGCSTSGGRLEVFARAAATNTLCARLGLDCPEDARCSGSVPVPEGEVELLFCLVLDGHGRYASARVPEGLDDAEVEVQLQSAASLSVHVVDADGSPVVGVDVRVSVSGWLDEVASDAMFSVATDAFGNAEFHGLPPHARVQYDAGSAGFVDLDGAGTLRVVELVKEE